MSLLQSAREGTDAIRPGRATHRLVRDGTGTADKSIDIDGLGGRHTATTVQGCTSLAITAPAPMTVMERTMTIARARLRARLRFLIWNSSFLDLSSGEFPLRSERFRAPNGRITPLTGPQTAGKRTKRGAPPWERPPKVTLVATLVAIFSRRILPPLRRKDLRPILGSILVAIFSPTHFGDEKAPPGGRGGGLRRRPPGGSAGACPRCHTCCSPCPPSAAP